MSTWGDMNKSLGDLQKGYYKLHSRYFFAGLPISVENPRGGVRFKQDRKTKAVEWRSVMAADYGYIRGTLAASDGDALDCYVNTSNPQSDKVFIVHQRKRGTQVYDEDKCFLGYNSVEGVKRDFYLSYDDGDLYWGPVTEMSLKRFKTRISGKNKRRLPMMRSWKVDEKHNYNKLKNRVKRL